MFEWCPQCTYFKDCYKDGCGPLYLEPECGYGPAVDNEEGDKENA